EGTDTSSKRTTSSSPLIATDEDLKRDPANPFNMDQIFGDFSRAAQMLLNKSGQGNMEDLKKTIPPFDWSLINPSVFGGKLEDMSTEDHSYFSGQKRKEWDAEQINLTTSPSPSTSTSISMSSDASATSSLRPGSTAPKLSKREREEMNAKMGTNAVNAMGYIKPTNDSTTTSSPIDFSDLKNFIGLDIEEMIQDEQVWQGRTKEGTLVSWHDSLHSVDSGPALFIAHEFFDALPISHFQYRPLGWIETLVDVDEGEDSPFHFLLTNADNTTFAGMALDKQFAMAGIRPEVGQQLTLCPVGNEIASDMAKWVAQHGGAGFIIDYGSENPPAWTVQGAKAHKPTNVLSQPGDVDISAHVNFGHLRSAMKAVPGINVFGPVTQSYFLQGCGIVHRFKHYLDNNIKDEAEKEKFIKTFCRIMNIDQLGSHFQVLGFAHKSIGTPVGFREPLS
ncbi:hypothetical protein RFI_30362, partial [Reticulomyxa filosa]